MKLAEAQLGKKITYGGAGVGKGHSRLGAPLFVLMHAMKLEPDSSELSVAAPILRKCHGVPCNYTYHKNPEGYLFDKMLVAHRTAAGRQRPNPLRHARMFQALAQTRIAKDPELGKRSTFEAVLDEVIKSYHTHAGVAGNESYQVREQDLEAVKNVALHVSPPVMDLAYKHLDRYKWTDCGRNHRSSVDILLLKSVSLKAVQANVASSSKWLLSYAPASNCYALRYHD